MLILGGFGFLAFGLWLLIDPAALFAAAGAPPPPQVLLPELRAFYGGLEIGLALFILSGLKSNEMLRPALWLVLAAFGGAALARVIGITVDGVFNQYLLIATVIEAALAAAALISLRPGSRRS